MKRYAVALLLLLPCLAAMADCTGLLLWLSALAGYPGRLPRLAFARCTGWPHWATGPTWPASCWTPTTQTPEAGPEKDTACPRCQLKLSEFKTKGWLGCSECYRHFEKDIDSLLMQVHGSTVHKGKVYRHSGPDKLDIKDMERLKSELSEAIEKEEFELAALIRDTLHSFNTQNGIQISKNAR